MKRAVGATVRLLEVVLDPFNGEDAARRRTLPQNGVASACVALVTFEFIRQFDTVAAILMVNQQCISINYQFF